MAADKYDFFFLGCWNNDDEIRNSKIQIVQDKIPTSKKIKLEERTGLKFEYLCEQLK